jgi:putative ABC transport system permease protein
VLALDKDLPILTVRTMADLVDGALQSDKFNTLLIGTFALLAIVMAALGIFGAMSYAMEQRTREFGVRLALGAPRTGILGLAVGESTRLGVIGTVLGLIAAIALARMLGDALYLIPGAHDGLLYGVSTTDPFTLGTACALLLLIAATAGLVPARRAMRVDPVVALRAD